MLLHAHALMDEYFNVSMMENSKVKDKGVILYLFRVAHYILGALVAVEL